MTEINQCPYTVCKSDKNGVNSVLVLGNTRWMVYCESCGAQGPERPTREEAIVAWNSLSDKCAAFEGSGDFDRYDAGLLGDAGGGNVDWWHDYIRYELDRAHDFYVDQIIQRDQGFDRLKEALTITTMYIGGSENDHSSLLDNDSLEIRFQARIGDLRTLWSVWNLYGKE